MTHSQHAILSELLVLQAQSGSREAIAQLAELWTPRLRSRAYRLTQDREATREILQESWVAIARGLRSLREPARFGPWAYRIVHNKAADWIKARSLNRSTHQQHSEETPNPTAHPSVSEGSVSAGSVSEDSALQIRVAVSTLDPKLREVVYLFYMDQCTLHQIAIVLKIPIGTVKTRLTRARKQLKSQLK